MSGNSQGDNRRPLDPKRGRAEPARADYLWADGTVRLLETREHASSGQSGSQRVYSARAGEKAGRQDDR